MKHALIGHPVCQPMFALFEGQDTAFDSQWSPGKDRTLRLQSGRRRCFAFTIQKEPV